jgi:hypothetical protein
MDITDGGFLVGSFCRTQSGEYQRAFPAIGAMKTVICTTKRNDCMNVMYSLTTAARFARIWRSDLVYNHRAGNTISTQTRRQEATAHDLPLAGFSFNWNNGQVCHDEVPDRQSFLRPSLSLTSLPHHRFPFPIPRLAR